MEEYKTSNLYEASFLACRGFNFIGKEQQGNKKQLIYRNSEELNQSVIGFYKGETVSAKEYSDWYRTLKDYIFS